MFSLLSCLLLFPAIEDTAFHENKELVFNYERQDTTLTFSSSFFVRCDSCTLLSILYEYEHLEKFIPGDFKMELYDSGDNWYVVRYQFNILFFHLETKYKRTLRGNQVDFEMISVSDVAPSVPTIKKSHGYYRMRKHGDGFLVEYYQVSITNNTALKNMIGKKVKSRALSFMKNLKAYVFDMCH